MYYLEAAATDVNTTGSMLGMILPLVLCGVIFYFFLYKPQKKQEKEAQDMRDNLQVGDEITTTGGIIGKVVSIKDETMVIETTRDATKIRMLKTSVRSVDVRAEDAQN
ncbi:MAG: preprotein translocase subunit YajC [Clostridia bacterium]|nr:preprotein translocase subunit YajC [Clostridia bacterium]